MLKDLQGVMRNHQIRTEWRDSRRTGLVTRLVERPIPTLRPGEALIEVLFVPMHGSFWLASHPSVRHPRAKEFLVDGGFVFGNGGVGRVLAVADPASAVEPGDLVAIMGHLPCERVDCHACSVLHRYVECDYGEGRIVGHGKHAPDGTFARYCVLPSEAYEPCFRAAEAPSSEAQILPYMLAFLLADVRNAMTRHPQTLSQRRMLLVGAGYSGHLAAWLLLQHSPDARILALDTAAERLASLKAMAPGAVETITLAPPPEDEGRDGAKCEGIERVSIALHRHFGREGADLVFDASSGDTLPLWLNRRVLGPGTHCIPFGFGSGGAPLTSDLIQLSGLMLLMSRGVGDRGNRRAVLNLFREGAGEAIAAHILSRARRLNGLDEAMRFIERQHRSDRPPAQVEQAYIAPSPRGQDNPVNIGPRQSLR